MKLPLSDPTMPATNGSGNGYYGQNNHAVVVIMEQPPPDPVENGDFSEYFWMENEEEFDKQVLKELEEEALMEQCMQAMIEDSQSPNGSSSQWQGESSPVSASDVPNGSGPELIMAMRGLQVNEHGSNVGDARGQRQSEARLTHEVGSGLHLQRFKFNPMAKEFIPGMSYYRPGGQSSSRNPCFSELVDNQPDA